MVSTTSIHNCLSFDILGHVFGYYVQDENILKPLETLLLVCKSWHDAAVSHRALWGQLKIYLGHRKTHKIWGTRLPLRLARSGKAPLLIELYNCLSSSYNWEDDEKEFEYKSLLSKRSCCRFGNYSRPCGCAVQADSVAQDLLVLLAGHNGENCSRWVDLILHLKTGDSPLGAAAVKALSYPTPCLSFLWLEEIYIDKYTENCAILPSSPCLMQFILEDSFFPTWPDLQNADDIKIRWKNVDDDDLEKFDALGMIQAPNASFLALNLPPGWNIRLPRAMSKLSALAMHQQKAPLPPDLCKASMPNLRKILFTIHSGPFLSQLLTLRGASLSQITSLFLRWKPMKRVDLRKARDALRRVLYACTSLEDLAGDEATLAVSLKLFWDGFHSGEEAYEDRFIVIYGHWTDQAFPLSSKKDASVAARKLGLPSPRSSWDTIFDFVIHESFEDNIGEETSEEEGESSESEEEGMLESGESDDEEEDGDGGYDGW